MTAEITRYVSWKDARAAIEGHEVEIVNSLGIPWRAGQRDHIRCPYPHHGGADDWRLNSKGRAICTCTGGKTDSVFDIAMKVEGLDEEQAKIRCVEIVGRTDLIRERPGDGQFQATDAESLLKARPERRDEMLPRAYLAHRLGIDATAVLMPMTPVVGLKGLGYYDPPRGKGTGKPVHVGDFPCAVFGTVDATGRQHAHRIYVAPAGAGKADLGRGPNGIERDAKKSAKRVGEESTAGRSVIWGDARRAPWCLIAEGIETGAAVAHAFQAEIADGRAYVAAAINAGGIEAFAPWPETKRVTVAADRDEAPKIMQPEPSRRGEQAGRIFGIRNHKRASVAIAIAGEPGTSTDWLDVHNTQGAEAVRAGILAAVAYRPTDEEIRDERQRVEGLNNLAQAERDYPLPELDTFTLTYKLTKTGRVKAHKWVKDEEGQLILSPISTPFGVPARIRYLDQADAYGLRITVEDMGGRCRAIDVSRADFAKQGASETRAMLYAAGLRTEDDGDLIAVKVLKAADPQNEIAVVRTPGWHSLDGSLDRFFVCPSGEVIGAPDNQALELSISSRISEAVAVGGTLEGWQAAVSAAASVTRCPHWALGAIAGFAAPLVALTGLDTCGVNLSGTTSGGKTTAQRLAVSAWSRAALDKRDSLLQSARATANGVEGMAARASGTILALDELGHVTGKELGKNIYSLASGVGKSRMTADAQLRASHTWSTFIVLSAEKSLEEKVRGDGGEWYGGMAARIPDVDITNVDRAVDQAVMARIQACDQHYGHAGPAFVRKLIELGYHLQAEQIRQAINQAADKLAGPGADSAMRRAALPFAILINAGLMACRFGILPANVDVKSTVDWAWGKFGASTDAAALNPEEQAVNSLRAWVAERWDSEVLPTEIEIGTKAPNRNASAWYDDTAVYIPAHRIVEAAGGTLKETEIGRALDAQGLIAKRKDKDCNFHTFVPKVGRFKVYALRRAEFRMVGREESPFAVHAGGRL
ncbi:DUF927 domain-containing protein [Methylobacterium pseudosasicola]|uniref:Toprim domain-containing protein n=1 Tax=Methylobacterium pseudosasicola TaxID=582667 RepID=A0A1I4SD26_9HYPH|nr:DUF927 domain-containing protein [Methylobacterium pseudosasicola]SFM62377.1 Toprim domain-containing protein [Methylobacterium pseudosasicola]